MATDSMNAKDRMIEILRRQPDESSYDTLLHELAFARMVERGMADSLEGRKIADEELGRRIESW